MENLSEYDTVYLTVVLFICTIVLFLKAASNFKTLETSSIQSIDAMDQSEKKTVLIVDDDPVTRASLGSKLKSLNFDVMEVTDGTSAVDLYENGRRFCLVVMDYEMPDMNGISAIKRIRTLDREVVIVGSTIHDPALFQQEFLNAGANLVDIKPIGVEKLLEVMSEYNLN